MNEAIRRAVVEERVRCVAIVEEATEDDGIQSCADAIIYIREGILQESDLTSIPARDSGWWCNACDEQPSTSRR